MPDVTGVHIPRALNNFSLNYKNTGYIADVFSPVVNVSFKSDKYFIFGREHFNIGPAIRAPKSLTTEIEYTLSTDQYFAETYGYHELIEDDERTNSDAGLNPDMDSTEHITECLMLDREYRVSQTILDSTNPEWGTLAATHFVNLQNAWSNIAGADPRANVYKAKRVVFKDSRRQANKILIPVDVSMQLCQVDSLDEFRKYTDPGLVTNSGLPKTLWGLTVTEAQSSYNNAVDGDSESFEETWGNNVVIAYVAERVSGRKTLTFAQTFQFRALQVRKWREEPKKSDVIEIDQSYDNKIVAPACGFVFLNATDQNA